jgi:putative ABC transport system permease protein
MKAKRDQPKERLPASLRFLRAFCPEALYEGIAGDLVEAYETQRALLGERRANRKLWTDVFRFLRPSIILRNSLTVRLMRSAMLAHMMRMAYRNAWKNKLFSFVNIAGLSLGIAASFMLFVHVRQELSYESHISNHELIYRLSTKFWAKTPPPMAEQLRTDFPEAHRVGRLETNSKVTVESSNATVFPSFTYFADPSIIDVFTIPFVHGNPATALDNLNSIVINETLASQLFKKGEDPLGKPLVLDGYRNFVVSGVMKDTPRTTHLKIDVLISIRQSSSFESTSKTWRAVATYVRFDKPEDAATVSEKLKEFENRFYEGFRDRAEIDRIGDFFELEPISTIHLQSHKEKEAEENSDMMYIYIFSTFGAMILMIACINFVNLFTAQAIRRVKEIGLRRVIGAGRPQLVMQFFGESFVMVAVSGLIGMALVWSVLPWYNEIATIQLSLDDLLKLDNVKMVAGLICGTAILAGSYPAFAVTSSVHSHINRQGTIEDAGFLRKILVGFQFVMSMFLIISAAVVFSQLEFLKEKDLGFRKREVVAIKLYGQLWVQATKHKDAMRSELLKSPLVKEMSLTDRTVGERFGFEGMKLVDRPDDPGIDTRHVFVDDRFLQTMGIELVEGSNFEGVPDSVPAYLLNESAARIAHMEDLVGRRAVNLAENQRPGRIVGIIKDFNYASLHSGIDPLVLEFSIEYPDYLLIRIDPADATGALLHIEQVLKKLAPGSIVSYTFLDDRLQSLYAKDVRLYKVTRIFSMVTVIVSILGLFALAAHTAEVRTKEMSIRKILGASFPQLMGLLSRDFLVIVVAALLLAVPLSIYAAREWLSGFKYRTDLSSMQFALPVVGVALLAMLAVWIQARRVAVSNPADTLKHE